MGRLVLFVVVIGVAVGLVMPSDLSVATKSEDMAPPTRMVESSEPAARPAVSSAPTASMTTFGTTVLKRSSNGHFFTKAAVNGIDVHFLVDTGASGVSLTVDDARTIGLMFNESEFNVIGSGASGPVRGKRIVLDRVSLDGRTVEQVDGAILEGGQMSLLGQSFLAQMGRIEIANDEMVIH